MSSTETPPESFFKYPPEVRNKMYEVLLRIKNCREQTVNKGFDDKPFFFDPLIDHRPLGTLQGLSLWNVKYNWHMGILAVNTQTYNEASTIPKEKNEWVSFTVNVNGLSTRLRDAGFKTVLAGRANEIKKPALKVELLYDGADGSDNFVCSTMDLPETCRGLSLTSGFGMAKLKLTLGTLLGGGLEAREWRLLGPFTTPIAKPGSLEVIGSKTPRIAEWSENFDGNVQESDEVVKKVINDELEESDTALQAEKWQVAHDKALSCQGLMDVVNKCDVGRQKYSNLVLEFPTIIYRSLSNMARARLELGDASGAFKQSEQIQVEGLPANSWFDAYLLQAMVAAATKHYDEAMVHFKSAYEISRSDPQLKEDLRRFEEDLVKDSAGNKDILEEVRSLLR